MKKLLLSALMLFFIYGCENKPAPEQDKTQENQSRSSEIADLQREIRLLRREVDSLSDGSAIVTPEEKGYDVAKTRYGSFTVICRNVSPYLDGYKVRLDIGNLTSATFNGAKIKIWWGEKSEPKEVNLTDSFLPGRLTPVELVMTPASTQDIKTFSLALEFDEMVLYHSRK